MTRQIEVPVYNNSIVTSRSLNKNHSNNQNLYKTSQEFQELLREVKRYRFFSPSAWEQHYLEPTNCVALRKSDLRKIETKQFDGTWRSSTLCVGYGNPFGQYQTNRYAPIEKYKIKLNRDKQQLSIIKI